MKRLLSLFLCLLMVFPLVLSVSAEEAVISITTRQDLEAIAKNPQGHYRLDADIDLGEKDWTPIPFSGHLDGRKHVIYNMTIKAPSMDTAVTVDGNNKQYDTHFAALFSITKNAVIENLKIFGGQVEVETGDHCFAALLAGYMENTRIQNCHVDGRVRLYGSNIMVGVGGFAGFGTGSISNCNANVDLTFADRSDHASDQRCEQFMGGLLACGNADLLDNTVKIQGWDSCWGFVHNGGLVGMFYRWVQEHPRGEICGNSVNGSITFFENNPKRRAYCGPYGGELLTYPSKMWKNSNDFQRRELQKQSQELKDHNCANPVFEEKQIVHSEDTWGFTLHKCKTCGYEYRTHYSAPGHVPGDWEILRDANYEQKGKKQKTCKVCGEVLTQELIPKRIPVEVIILSENGLTMHYKDQFHMKAHIRPKDAENQEVTWISSNSKVVSVDQEGNLTAHKRGTALITCKSKDGFATSNCPIHVTYSPLQWVIKVLLFGWIWY